MEQYCFMFYSNELFKQLYWLIMFQKYVILKFLNYLFALIMGKVSKLIS